MIDDIFCKLAICYHFMFQNAKKYFASHVLTFERECFLQLWNDIPSLNIRFWNPDVYRKSKIKSLLKLRNRYQNRQIFHNFSSKILSKSVFFVFDVYLWSVVRVILRFECEIKILKVIHYVCIHSFNSIQFKRL